MLAIDHDKVEYATSVPPQIGRGDVADIGPMDADVAEIVVIEPAQFPDPCGPPHFIL